MDGGTNNPANPAEYEKDAGDVTLQNPTKEGCNFKGWFTEPEFTNQVTAITNGTEGNIDLYAKWEATTYTISYELNGGTNNASNPTGYNATTLPITLLEPTKAGATFAGWYDNSSFSGSPVTELAGGSTGDKTFYAKWNMVTYTIAYDLDGGSFSTTAVTSYTVNDLPLTLENPSKEGYTFLGWTSSNESIPQTSVIIPAGTTENLTYTANWEVNEGNVTFIYNLDNCTDTTYHIDYGYGHDDECYTLLSEPVTLSWDELVNAGNDLNYKYGLLGNTLITEYSIDFTNLKTVMAVKIPNGIESIRFTNCANLNSVSIGEGITSIEESTFANTSLISINIPNSVETIGNYAFYDCFSLVSVTMPIGIKSIGNEAFSPNPASPSMLLSRINSNEDGVFNLPDNLTSIGEGAFNDCASLVSINLPDNLTSIGNGAFAGCTSLSSLTIPNNVTSFGYNTFYGCTNLSTAVIGNSVTTIENSAFANCTSLTSLTIGSSVSSIEFQALCNCTSLADIYYVGSKEQWNNIVKNSNWDDATPEYTIHCTDGDITKS